MTLTLQFKALEHFEGLALPNFETKLAAGADLRAAVGQSDPLTLSPGERALVPTGLCMACLLYTSPSPRDQRGSRMPSSA